MQRKEKLLFHSPSGFLIPKDFVDESKDYVSRDIFSAVTFRQ